MPTSFFTTTGKFYRGNLHTHSTRSDGVLDPKEVCRRYRAEGYDFIALTDHFIGLFDYPITDTTSCCTNGFATIVGAELHTGTMENGHLWHLLGIGLPADFTPPDAPNFRPVKGSESAPHIAQRARDAGAFVTIAHPHWSGLTEADARTITAAHAVEIYNHGCVVDNDRGEGFLTGPSPEPDRHRRRPFQYPRPFRRLGHGQGAREQTASPACCAQSGRILLQHRPAD